MANSDDPEAMRGRLVQLLEKNRGLAPDVANWAVDTWSYALGVGLVRRSDRVEETAGGRRTRSADQLLADLPHVIEKAIHASFHPRTRRCGRAGDGKRTAEGDVRHSRRHLSLRAMHGGELLRPGYGTPKEGNDSVLGVRRPVGEPPRMRLGGEYDPHLVVLSHGTQLFPHHLERDTYNFSRVLGEVTVNPVARHLEQSRPRWIDYGGSPERDAADR